MNLSTFLKISLPRMYVWPERRLMVTIVGDSVWKLNVIETTMVMVNFSSSSCKFHSCKQDMKKREIVKDNLLYVRKWRKSIGALKCIRGFGFSSRGYDVNNFIAKYCESPCLLGLILIC